MPSDRGRRAAGLAAALLAAAGLAWWVFEPAPARSPLVAGTAPAEPPAAAGAELPRAPYSTNGQQALQAQRRPWQQRLERAQEALDAYRQSTRYPPGSQPLGAQADQSRPNDPVDDARPFGKGASGASLHTTQERVFVVGSESVRFGVSLRDRSAAGTALPMRVVRASAREITPPSLGSLYPELPLNFNDEGQEGDALGADGVYSVRLQPQAQGFAGLFGQIRVDALLEYRGEQDLVHFDILYTPEAPAVWLGPVHEALEGGSLSLVLKARVREAGRYIVSARVDDAKGQPLALLSFNDEVAEGEQEFRLTLFGKLVRDARPAFPLTVRDVNGFLLHPDTFPDRSLMSGLEGTVHQTQDYPLTSFDAAEWRSEERTRYLVELGHDVSDAKAQLDRLGSRP